ncbi:MAG: hypothetical protein AAF791_12550 [Bacteroidota bacterium]
MPQSLLGLLALTLASLISFNQQRVTQQSHKATIRDELELAAAGTAQHVMEMIAARSFDEATTPEKVFRLGLIPVGAGSFTRTNDAEFGRYRNNGCDLMTPGNSMPCDDMDDLHGTRGAPVEARLSDGRVLPFTADVEVSYVTDPGSQTPSLVPTLHKRVDLTINSEHAAAPIDAIVSITRVVSYDPMKADMDSEERCGPIGTSGSPCGTSSSTIPAN